MSDKQVKRIPAAEVPPKVPDVLTITVEVPVTVDQRSGLRTEISYLQTLMKRYPGPTRKFYEEMTATK